MDELECMCRAHHEVREKQGFTTATWDQLEERNREQYREAMRAAKARRLEDAGNGYAVRSYER